MDFSTEKFISNFIQTQFPMFYREEGENFTLFMKAYYEWMESEGNPVRESRKLLQYRDIDGTVEKFLEYFQKKYLYGIPFNIISNKRFLLKHILDVYRSKGTIQCYRLLFKLIYDEDVKVYLPGIDVLKASHGTWKQPKYLEITPSVKNNSFLGNVIVGTTSGTTAVVENYVREAIGKDIIDILYISNVLPNGGEFIIGEKIVLQSELGDFTALAESPNIIGSLLKLDILNGGQGFKIGDLVKIVHKDPITNEVVTPGIGGIVKITSLVRGEGQMNFDIITGGFGYSSNSKVFLYTNPLDTGGQGASVKLGSVSDTTEITYNKDIVCDYLDSYINATSYGFPGNTSANVSSVIGTTFQYATGIFGSIATLSEIKTGNGYQYSANLFIRDVMLSNTLPGSITYTTACTHVTGSGTEFERFFQNNDVIYLKANSSLDSTSEYVMIKNVVSDTDIELWKKPSYSSTGSAQFKAAPVILPSNFAVYETVMKRIDGTINGKNEIINAFPSFGTDIAGHTLVVNSGKAYSDGEIVSAYLYGSLQTPTVVSAGSGYTNGEILVFSGGGENFITPAKGYITTNLSGNVVSATLTYIGSGYISDPKIIIKSKNGSGCVLTTKMQEYNTFSEVKGKVVKQSIGKGSGYWTTTRGFLNSDKYIHDSYYYQDYSYEVRVPLILETYKDILYNTFHPSGSEMFGKFSLDIIHPRNFGILFDSDYGLTVQIFDELVSLTSDTDATFSDNDFYQVDAYDAFTVKANTDFVNSLEDAIKINNSGNTFAPGDYVYYQVPAGNTAITGLIANSYYYIAFSNQSHIGLSNEKDGPFINIIESRTDSSPENHVIYVVEKNG